MPHFCKNRIQKTTSRAVGRPSAYWTAGQVIRIAFLGGTPEQHYFVRNTAALWLSHANLIFQYVDNPNNSDVRITFDETDGAWSYLGTDNLKIPKGNATMNLGWLTAGVVLHEFGHLLGLEHEHQNPSEGIRWNRDRVIADLSAAPNYWSIEQIEHNVLNALDATQTQYTDFDKDSVMLYFFPASWTMDGSGTRENDSISGVDAEFVAQIYPKAQQTELTAIDLLYTYFDESVYAGLTETTICEIAKEIGAECNPKKRKKDNIRILTKKVAELANTDHE